MTNRPLSSFRLRNELIFPPLVLFLITAFIYAFFFRATYTGFSFDTTSWEVSEIYTAQNEAGPHLKVGDVLLRIGKITIPEYQADRSIQLFGGMHRGQVIPLLVERKGEVFTVNWPIAGPTEGEVRDRLLSAWWLAYVFWVFGSASYLLLRPKDTRRRLLICLNYITGLVIATGSSSAWSVWNSGTWYHIALWIAVPIFIHLHWVFPLRLGKAPKWVTYVGYGAAVALSIATWYQAIPSNLGYLGFLVAAVTSVTLLLIHYARQPHVRRTLSMLLFATLIACFPIVLISLTRLTNARFFISSSLLMALPVLPGIYFLAIYRRQVGGIEMRANRIISLYIFLTALAAFNLLILSIVTTYSHLTSTALLLAFLLPISSASLVVLLFPWFEGWVERRLLGIPLPPTHLLERYASRISTSPDPQQLVQILRDDVLRSLMVRQSALLCFDDAGKTYSLYQEGLNSSFNPRDDCVLSLWASAGHYRNPAIPTDSHPALAWVRLAVPLMAGNRRLGLWLLGRRDPDDFYAAVEIHTLQALADQTAVALLNNQQAEHLSRLYQADIDRQEVERLQLALELHDGVLNQLGILALTVDDHNDTFEAAYQKAASNIRQIISGLRPTMLNYGLHSALDELADEAPSQVHADVEIQVDLQDMDVRYHPQIELHLYRIVQEACQNALQHAQAKTIRISGSLYPDCFDLTIVDDGAGFSRGQQLELDSLLADKHFGLAGMIERARLIGAHMDIASMPGAGTRVRVYGDVQPS